MNQFWFDGKSSVDYSIYLSEPPQEPAPLRSIKLLRAPGRSGDLLIDTGRYDNVKLTYRCSLLSRQNDFRLAALNAIDFLRSTASYYTLQNTFTPEYYRMAYVASTMTIESMFEQGGSFNVVFDCKPQRYLKRGELPVTLPAGGAARLMNQGFPALPLITVYGAGAGALTVAGVTVNFLDRFAGPIVLDCDTQNAYFAGVNKNTEIYAPAFPVLPAGECPISWSGGVERVEIVPRWWTL